MIGVYTGPRHAGKTTRLAVLCREWRAAGRRVGGYLSVAVRMGGLEPYFSAPGSDGRDGGEGLSGRAGSPAGYDLFEIQTEASYPFLRRKAVVEEHGPGERVGRWIFVPEGLARAREIVRLAPPDALLVVDEFGPLELRGGGVRAEFDEALRAPGRRVLVVVREALCGAFLETYGAADAKIYDARQPGAGEDLTRDLFGGPE